MEWLEVLTIILANMGLFLWSRQEARADHRMTLQIIKDIETKIDSWKREIDEEMKDFHGRLSVIDEKHKTRKH
jgi:hypothetical protein